MPSKYNFLQRDLKRIKLEIDKFYDEHPEVVLKKQVAGKKGYFDIDAIYYEIAQQLINLQYAKRG